MAKKKYKVAVVDDEQDIADLVKMILNRSGIDVVTFLCIGDARKYMKSHSDLDLVILDLRLPDGNGLDLCKEMQSDPKLAGIKVVLFTASTSIDDSMREQCNVAGLSQKPFDAKEFVSLIEGILKKG